MKPGIDHMMMLMAGTLAEKVMPSIPEADYATGHVRMIALMQVLLAQVVDKAADILINENAAMRTLFADAAQTPLTGLKARLQEAAATSDASARLSVLEAGNAMLKAVLIDLHLTVEDCDADWARTLNRRILSFLKDSADVRMLVIPTI
jgi:hypothetical protein